jgi:penicillin-insensitive murein endopeptidase
MRTAATLALCLCPLLGSAPAASGQTLSAKQDGAAAPQPAIGSVPAAPAALVPPTPVPAKPEARLPAKQLFGAVKTAAPLEARAIGFYAKGCLAGAQALPVDGPAWQAMRLSRNRNWGHPDLVRLIERLAMEAKERDGWPGLLVGDMSQPRGGPMLTGHASHQIGLDADIWLTPMPDRRLSPQEREELSAVSMLGPDKLSVDPTVWTPRHVRLIRRAASYPEVDRIFVHPAIKKALCDGAAQAGSDRRWLSKVRPYWGHHYHFHIRLDCPKDSASCKPQPEPSHDDGCGKEVQDWLALLAKPPEPAPAKPQPPKPPITLAQLPGECRAVLHAGSSEATGGNGKTAAGQR